MADYFSEQAREALNLAYRAARTMNNSHIGTEHILLGLVRQGTGVAARVLMENEVTEKKLTEMIDRVLKPRIRVIRQTLTPRKTADNKPVSSGTDRGPLAAMYTGIRNLPS